jgi:hypothetical protein
LAQRLLLDLAPPQGNSTNYSIPASTRMSHPASALYHGQGNTGSAIMNLSRIVAR